MTVTTYTLFGTPFYDRYTQCYKKIIKINKMPTENTPLKTIVKQINNPILSPFQANSSFSSCSNCCNSSYQSCMNVITKLNNPHELMCIEDIPELFSFLVSNNYTIDTSITKMMQQSNVKFNNDLICFISYS